MRFALEVHPTEIAYDFVTTRKALAAIGHRQGFGINFDPSHLEHQFLDSAAFITEFADRIYHVHVKDSVRRLDGRSSILGGHLNFGEPGRGWDFVSPGHGDVDFEAMIRALNRIGYDGPLSIEWEDSGMDRDVGRAGRAGVRAPNRLRPLGGRVRRGVREGGLTVSETSFGTMGQASGGGDAQPIGVGMLGYAFMGKAHSNAYKKIAYMTWPPPLRPELVAIAGRNEEAVAEAARRYGFAEHVTDWKALVADDRIRLFDNSGPNNLHAEPTIAAAEAGKHVICEKPLGRDAAESYETWQRVAGHGRQAHVRVQLPLRAGRPAGAAGRSSRASIGEITHFRGSYLQEWGADERRGVALRQGRSPARARSATSARTWSTSRATWSARSRRCRRSPRRSSPAARSTTRSSRSSRSRTARSARSRRRAWRPGARTRSAGRSTARRARSRSTWSASTSCRSTTRTRSPAPSTQGFRTVLVSEADHPFWEHWWPHGHIIGWEHTFVHELHHLLTAIRDDGDVAPHGATLEDGYRAAEVCDAMLRSSQQGTREAVSYRSGGS